MMKVLLLFLSISYFPTHAQGDEHSNKYRVIKTISVNSNQKVYVVVREDGHLLGQPYQVELRVSCANDSKDIINLPIKNSFSVCDVSPTSLKLNQQKSAVALKVKMADLSSYYDQLDSGDVSPTVQCSQNTEIKKFSLRNLCSSSKPKS